MISRFEENSEKYVKTPENKKSVIWTFGSKIVRAIMAIKRGDFISTLKDSIFSHKHSVFEAQLCLNF